MSNPVLSLSDVSLTLMGNAGPVEILHDIVLDVPQGQTVGLVGPSGSGKSSLLMVMGGLEMATGGQVTALGQDLTAMNEDQLALFRRDHMGVGFQSFHLIPTMTALENVATPLERVVSSSALPLRVRLPHAPKSCSRMNPLETLMKPMGGRSWICCLTYATATVRP